MKWQGSAVRKGGKGRAKMILSVKPFRYYRYISPVSPADVPTEKNMPESFPVDKKVRTLQI